MSLTTLILCLLLLGAVVAWIAWPLRAAPVRPTPVVHSAQARDRAVRALRDLEFDQATGLVPPEAYEAQKAELLARIVVASDDPGAPAGDD